MVWPAACAAAFVLACSDGNSDTVRLAVSGGPFGNALPGSTVDRTFTVSNEGATATGVLTIEVSDLDAPEFTILAPETGECESGVTSLDVGASCTMRVRWSVVGWGARSAMLSVMAPNGSAAGTSLDGWGGVHVMVSKNGVGTVTSVPAGIDCGNTCVAYFATDSITLQARTANGSGHIFSGWLGAGCGGLGRDCTVSATADLYPVVMATFSPISHNLVFVSSVPVGTNPGGVAAFDAQCNVLASSAGINNASGNAYVAWVSSPTSNAPTRMGSARGFVRIDGKPVGDRISDLASGDNKILHAISIDENGVNPGNVPVLTGTWSNGTTSDATCAGYTSASSTDYYLFGDSMGGPRFWTHDNARDCSNPARIYCFMKTIDAQLVPEVTAGKKIWVTNTPYTPGAQTPDEKCAAEMPQGVSSAKALITSTVTPASSALSHATYVRPDGQVVGTYYEIVAARDLRTGPWQQADGVYSGAVVWTGNSGVLTNTASDATTTCSDWTNNTSGSGRAGHVAFADALWWTTGPVGCMSTLTRLICVEQ